MNRDFFRKIGFGLRPDEDIPSDPLKWAEAQIEAPAPLTWPGEIPSGQALLDHRAHFVYQDRRVLRKEFKTDRLAYQAAKKQLRYKTGERYFSNLETAIRHHAAIHGKAPFFERLWHFWSNHFAISDKDMLERWNTGAYQREIIRPHICGNFTDLVKTVTLSWTMMHHLDNEKSIGPNSKKGKWRRKRNKAVSVNENHARELLELHTVSPTAGYTQQDVIALSYIMAGWGAEHTKKREECNPVTFNQDKHEPGNHKVLGKSYKQRGITPKNKLLDCIEDLCANPHARRFISWKLVRHFVTDEPTDEMTAPLIKAWEESDGNLQAVYRALIRVVHEHTATHKKFLSPETWLLQCVRISGAQWPPTPEMMAYDFKTKPSFWARQPMILMREMGHNLLAPAQPNGWPDTSAEWLSPELLIRRLAAARMLTNKREIAPRINYEEVLRKNFDTQDDILPLLRDSSFNGSLTSQSAGQNLFASEWMMIV